MYGGSSAVAMNAGVRGGRGGGGEGRGEGREGREGRIDYVCMYKYVTLNNKHVHVHEN